MSEQERRYSCTKPRAFRCFFAKNPQNQPGAKVLINTRAQCGIIACGRADSCHLQPISFVLNHAMRCLNTKKRLNNKVAIYKMQKILQLNDICILEVKKFMYKYTNSQLPATFNNIFHSLPHMFIHFIQDKSKLDNLLC